MNLAVAPGEVTRPTGARVRAAVLNMLQADIEGARVLDLFAGTGALGLEAVSRGAVSAHFVEKDRGALRALEKNVAEARRRLDKQSLPEIALRILAQEVEAVLGGEAGQLFDLAWADPPWLLVPTLTPRLLSGLTNRVVKGGAFVLESGDGEDEVSPMTVDGWDLTKTKSYGKTRITIYRRM